VLVSPVYQLSRTENSHLLESSPLPHLLWGAFCSVSTLGGTQKKTRGTEVKESLHYTCGALNVTFTAVATHGLCSVDAFCFASKSPWNKIITGSHVCSRVSFSKLLSRFRLNLIMKLHLQLKGWIFHGGEDSSRGHLSCDAFSVVVGYRRFRGPCCLHLQCSVVVG
jgi:hypothetical protein